MIDLIRYAEETWNGLLLNNDILTLFAMHWGNRQIHLDTVIKMTCGIGSSDKTIRLTLPVAVKFRYAILQNK